MLSKLGIRQKLSLLLTVPLVIVVVTLVPFSVDRVDESRAAAATVEAATEAQQVGRLVQELEKERLLAVGYLALPSLDSAAVVGQMEAVADTVARLRRSVAPKSPEIAAALDGLATLEPVRQAVLRRDGAPVGVFSAYRAAMVSLIDALGLTALPTVDLSGQRQLTSLDALLRANQEASGLGAALVMAAGALRVSQVPDGGVQDALGNSFGSPGLYGDQFRRTAETGQAALLDIVERGSTAQQLTRVARGVLLNDTAATISVPSAVAIADSYADLRRTVQERVARDIGDRAQLRATEAQAAAAGTIGAAMLVFVLLVSLSVTVSRSIALPLRRLIRAAGAVADLASAEMVRVADSDEVESGPPRLAAVDIRTADEMGELATAINRVQATAALLLERQISTRRNVSTMFTNIAQRTQSMAGRQLAFIDDLERDQQDAGLLEKLYRLDHLTARLRRSADSLLVVAGGKDRSGMPEPAPLADVIRSALGEIEGFRAVRLGEIGEVVIAADLVDDLRLLVAELLENGTAFSPPGAMVEVSVELGAEVRVVIVDHGIGMPPGRMSEENNRLIERERLDVAPTSTLGLFVVGRLARRHGLGVNLRPTTGGGVTVTVTVPRDQIVYQDPNTIPRRSPLEIALPDFPMSILNRDLSGGTEDFSWFEPERIALAATPHAEFVDDEEQPAYPDRIQAETFHADPHRAQSQNGDRGPADQGEPAGDPYWGVAAAPPVPAAPAAAAPGSFAAGTVGGPEPSLADAWQSESRSAARQSEPHPHWEPEPHPPWESEPRAPWPSEPAAGRQGAGPESFHGDRLRAEPVGSDFEAFGPAAGGFDPATPSAASHPVAPPAPAAPGATQSAPDPVTPPPSWATSGLSRRQPGAYIPVFDAPPPSARGAAARPEPTSPATPPSLTPPSAPAAPPVRDAEAERAQLDAFQSGAARAADAAGDTDPAPTGTADLTDTADLTAAAGATGTAGATGAAGATGTADPTGTRHEAGSSAAGNGSTPGSWPPATGAPGAGATRPPWPAPAADASPAALSEPTVETRAVSRPGPAMAQSTPAAPPVPAAPQPPPQPPSRAGLTRRVPGANLAESLRDAPPSPRAAAAAAVAAAAGIAPPSSTAERDAEAERNALDGYTAGLERAMRSGSTSENDQDHR